jgi:hypothetical protein
MHSTNRWLPEIKSIDDLEKLVGEIGFLPFFTNNISGFSIEECINPLYWFNDNVDGPWEWKNDIAVSGKIAYGKLFHGKTGYVSMEWYPYLANYRREGYDFDSRYEDGKSSRRDKILVDFLSSRKSAVSFELRELLGSEKSKFETSITRLQMQTYVSTAGFTHKTDRNGNEYGWGIAMYATSEKLFGEEICRSCYEEDPTESFEKIIRHVSEIVPAGTDKEQIIKLMK